MPSDNKKILAGLILIGAIGISVIVRLLTVNQSTENSPSPSLIENPPIATSSDDTANQINELRQEINSLKQQKKVPAPSSQGNELSNQEIAQISNSIAYVQCFFNNNYISGSGTYIQTKSGPLVLTNAHVVLTGNQTAKQCFVQFTDSKYPTLGLGMTIDASIYSTYYTDYVDYAYLKLGGFTSVEGSNAAVQDPVRSGTILDMSICPNNLDTGTKVYIFGYPLSGYETSNAFGYSATNQNLIVVPTSISGTRDTTIVAGGYALRPSPNYLISSPIDSGNSGGLAVAKINGTICEVGIPTWVSKGNYENLGIIQSIQHINNLSK